MIMTKNYKFLLFLIVLLFCASFAFADTEILRPEADGFVNSNTPVGCTNNWECVNESTPDDDTSYLHTTAVQTYQFDLFELPSFSGGAFDTINSINISYRVRCENAGGSVCRFRSYLRTNGSNVQGTEHLSAGVSYVDFTETYTTNPVTSNPWTISEVNALQAGIGLNGFLNSDGNRARGTQVYVTVGFTAAQQPVVTFVAPTPANNTYINTNWTIINVTTDLPAHTAILEINGTNFTMSGSGTNFFINATNLSDCSDYPYKVYANSTTSGLWGVSESRVVKISIDAPAVNWNTPATDLLNFYDEFNISATVLNCNLSQINVSIYQTLNTSDVIFFKQISVGGNATYNVFEPTNFTLTLEPLQLLTVEICANNAGGLTGCSTRDFVYNSLTASPQHTSDMINSFTFSSATYVTLLNITFNQSIKNNGTIKSSFFVQKLDVPGQSSDVYVKYILNGQTLCDESVVTVPGRFIFRSAETCISEGETVVGLNNLIIQVRRTNTGTINIQNWNLHFENGQSNFFGDYRRDINTLNSTITGGIGFQPVLNFTTEKRTNSTTYMDYSITVIPTLVATVECYLSNGIDNTTSQVRSTSVALESISMGSQIVTTVPKDVTETWTLYCSQDVSSSFIDIEAYTQDTISDANRTLQTQYNVNNSITPLTPLTLNAGKTKILEILNYEVQGSKGIDLIQSANLESLTGSQDINVSIEVSNILKSYSTYHLRSFSTTGQQGVVKFYGDISNLSIGEKVNITLYVTISGGESADLLSASMVGRDISDLVTESLDFPPFVLITYPANNSIQWFNNQDINVSAFDINDDLDFCKAELFKWVDIASDLLDDFSTQKFNNDVRCSTNPYSGLNSLCAANISTISYINTTIAHSAGIKTYAMKISKSAITGKTLGLYFGNNKPPADFDASVALDIGTGAGQDFFDFNAFPIEQNGTLSGNDVYDDVKVVIDVTNDFYELYLNSVMILNVSVSIPQTISAIGVEDTGGVATSNIYLDDIYVCDGRDLNCNNNYKFNRTIDPNFLEHTTIDYELNTYGNYSILATCFDTLNNAGTDEVFITLSCIENWVPQFSQCAFPGIVTKTYTDTSACGTTTNLPADNGSMSSCLYNSMQIDLLNFQDGLVLGKDLSFIGLLKIKNSTTKVTNAICTYSAYVNTTVNDTILFETFESKSDGNALMYYTVNSNDWKRRTEFDLIGKRGLLTVSCYCRPDNTDSSVNGGCLLDNGTLLTNYEVVTQHFSFNITEDQTIEQKESRNITFAVLILLVILMGLLLKTGSHFMRKKQLNENGEINENIAVLKLIGIVFYQGALLMIPIIAFIVMRSAVGLSYYSLLSTIFNITMTVFGWINGILFLVTGITLAILGISSSLGLFKK